MMRFFDTHAHMHYQGATYPSEGSPLNPQRDKWHDAQAHQRWQEALAYTPELTHVLLPSVSPECWHPILTMLAQYPQWVGALSIHPTEVATWKASWAQETWWQTLETHLLQTPQLVAVGETGLDFYWDKDPEVQALQKTFFCKTLALAQTLGKPVIVHDRDAHQAIATCLEEVVYTAYHQQQRPWRGVMHCFSGDVAFAHTMREHGMMISFAGNVTFKNAHALREVVKATPLDAILIETDTPYLTPHPFRGKPNHAGYVKLVAHCIAEVKGITLEEVARVTFQNACTLFHMVA
ncbi:MAG: TatD family hydrolase [Vampirovibrionales bacterium]